MRACSIPSSNDCSELVGNRPAHVALGTAVLAALVHLDGSGAVTFLIVIPAFAPLYDRLGMDRRVLACTAAMAAGVNNMLPWGGPTLRAAGALNQPMTAIYNPLIVPQLIGLAAVFAFSYWLGKREEQRLGWADDTQSIGAGGSCSDEQWAHVLAECRITAPSWSR